jgi:hypothetical protein
MSFVVSETFCDTFIHRLHKNDEKVLKSYQNGKFSTPKNYLHPFQPLQAIEKIKLNFVSKDLIGYFDIAKELYEKLPLQPAQASDQRIWTYLTHNVFGDFMGKLRPINDTTKGDYIIEHYFCKSAKALLYNDIALFWWLFYLTEQPQNPHDKYILTREVFTMRDYTRHLFSGKQGRSIEFRHGVLEYVVENPKIFENSKEAKVRLIMSNLNTIAGSTLLSSYSTSEIKNLINSFKDELELCKK